MQETDYRRIERAIRYLQENFLGQPSLGEVARRIGLSEYHFQRLFTRWAGISPKRFLQFLTAEHAKDLLRNTPTVLDAAFDAGLSGPGRLHDLTVRVYGATPGELKTEGEGLTIRYGVQASPFGECFLAATEKGICALSFPPGRQAEAAIGLLRTQWRKANLVEDRKITKALADRIFLPSRRRDVPTLNVFVRGTNFQIRVWEALLRIPRGYAASYEDIANRVDTPGAARAVGNAVGANPVAILIPCHRVLRKTGAFGGYGGGPARKKAILAWEAASRMA
jgi:AraC family transcriptional regulator, regulatory protein of adaptative response / methylated-DNA-[protein]-cysteine methyltransferase